MNKEKLQEYWEDCVVFFKLIRSKLKRGIPQTVNKAELADPVIIVVDLNGGDKAPKAVIRGIRRAISEGFVESEEIIAIGTKEATEKFKERNWLYRKFSRFKFFKNILDEILVLECEDQINMDDEPLAVLRKKNSSAMAIGIQMIKNGKASAVVSAGNTAGMVILGSLILGRLKNDLKPAIAVPLPNDAGACLLLDSGAGHRATAEELLNFAVMGTIYAQTMWGIEKPIVKLLNIGSEKSKGNKDLRKANELLLESATQGKINYGGNIEGDKVFIELANIIVCSGELGNNTIKVAEGVLNLVKDKMGIVWKLISFFWNHHKRADAEEVGGAILLGIKGVLIIGHGKSDSLAIANAIRRAKQEARMKVVEKIEQLI